MATWYEQAGSWRKNNFITPNDGISVEEQINNDSSLFNHYKKLIRLKQSHPALANGAFKHAINDNDNVFSFYRYNNTDKALVVVNLSGEEQVAMFNEININEKLLFGKSQLYNNRIQLSPFDVAVFDIKMNE
jgi:glycosidase